jgi:hypothetical protein
MQGRAVSNVLLLLACAWLCGCNAFDDSGLERPGPTSGAGSGGVGGASGSTPPDGGGGDSGPMCIEAPEACNDNDDDCDGDVDEDTAEACNVIVLNSVTECVRVGDRKRCVGRGCLPGFDDCDGNPANGCEAVACTCRPCADDGGMDDAGEDDSGTADAGDAGDD